MRIHTHITQLSNHTAFFKVKECHSDLCYHRSAANQRHISCEVVIIGADVPLVSHRASAISLLVHSNIELDGVPFLPPDQ